MVPRAAADAVDGDGGLSTGARGEFLRKRHRGFFFAESKPIGKAELPTTAGISSVPFWKSVFDGTRQGWLYLGMTVLGVLFILLGIAVIVRKGPAGWVEVILGAALIATPIIRTARKRKAILEAEEKARAEREETERRHREMLSAYVAALERLRAEPNDITLATVARERERLELPYAIWCSLARRTVLEIGFDALAKHGTAGAKQVSDLMTRASDAVGLEPADELGVRLDLYRVAVWHLLADDRCGDAQREALLAFRKGFDIWDRDVPVEAQAAEEFRRLRGLTTEELPREECPFPLGFHEYCVRAAKGAVLKKVREKSDGRRVEKLVPDEPCTVVITNKRVIVEAKKRLEVPLMKIDDVELDVDQNLLRIGTARGIKPLELQVEEPIYTGAILNMALGIDERPRGFA